MQIRGTAQIGSCQLKELPIALTCWRWENFTGITIAAGNMSGAEVENSHNPASMLMMFHSPVAIDCTSAPSVRRTVRRGNR